MNRDREIVFLYRLVDGKSQDSFGRICAAMAGVDEATLEVSGLHMTCIDCFGFDCVTTMTKH